MSGFREKFISSTSSSASGPRRSPAKFVVAKAEEIFTPPSQRSQFDLIVDDEVSSRRRSPESRSQVEGSPMKFRALGKKTEFEFATPESASELVLDEPGVEDDGSLRTRVAIPAALACKLRSYQVDGVRFLYQRWKEDLGSILGDDMGLGKTIQVVSLLVALCANRVGKFLIITPLTCSDQWTHELTRWGGLRSSLFHGGTTAKRAAMADVQSGRVDILVTSYETYLQEVDVLAPFQWAGVVFDELHKLKSSRTKLYQELYSVVHFIQPGCFGTSASFEANFITPIKNGLRRDASALELAHSKAASETLYQRLCIGSPPGGAVYLRRDKSLIAHTLPKKEDSILFCSMTPMQIDLYSKMLLLPEFQLLFDSVQKCPHHGTPRRQCCLANRGNELSAVMLSALGSLRKVSNSLYRVLDDKLASKAVDADLRNRIEQMHLEHDLALSGKMQVLRQFLPEWKAENSKVLIFSQSTKMLDIIERLLRRMDYSLCRLDGKVNGDKRQAEIDSFSNNASKFVFLISTKTGGTGLNLCAANIVVIFDPDWNGSNDAQAADRIYRIGQTRDTRIFRFISAGTIEESMYMRQVYKQQLGNTAMYRSDEMRLFGKDELFGLANLLHLNESSSRTAEILSKTAKQYELVKNELADVREKGVLEKVLQKDFTGLSEDHLDCDNDAEAENNIAGIVYSHSTSKLVGDNVVEKHLKSSLVERLQEPEKTAAEIQREADPVAFNSQKAAFIAARRKQASAPPNIPIVRK